jgi:hypothetical protein
MYYVLNFLQDQTSFKNPQHLDKMTPEERAISFIKVAEDVGQTDYHEDYTLTPTTP